jgi:hypothetical protein
MKKNFLVLFLMCLLTLNVSAVDRTALRNFFSEQYVQRLFNFAHPNAKRLSSVTIESINSDRVIIRAAFEGSILSGTYVCTFTIFIDEYGRFTNISNSCGKSIYPCFSYAAGDIKDECRRRDNGRVISYMERLYGKSLGEFSGREAMCTLLNIVWLKY